MAFDPASKLRISPELRITCRSGTEFTLELGQQTIFGGPHTLSVVNALRAPCSLNSALQTLKAQVAGIHDWMELTSQVMILHRAGMLVDDDAWNASASLASGGQGFGSAPIHIAMLDDTERTRRYLAAIRATVRPGDVVVDMGTGSGVMAVAAAQAGAARVYAIEATGIAKAARRIFEANGVVDRITLIESYSTQVELPEKAVVLVAEVIGNEPLAEKILECTADAVRRFLKPGARLIPARLKVMAIPVELPSALLEQVLISPAKLAIWQRDYGIDFSPLAALAKNSELNLNEKQASVAKWTALADPELVSDFDLAKPVHSERDVRGQFKVTRNGRIDGFVLWFAAELADDNVLSTDPRSPRPDNHWRHPVYLLAEPLTVQAGETVAMWIEGNKKRSVRAELVDAQA